MQISGKLVSIISKKYQTEIFPAIYKGNLLNSISENDKFTIELPPVDVSKIKNKDTILLRIVLDDEDKIHKEVLSLMNGAIKMHIEDIVAHFPATSEQPKTEEKKKVKLPEKFHPDTMVPDSIAEKINTLIDAVAQLAERVK